MEMQIAEYELPLGEILQTHRFIYLSQVVGSLVSSIYGKKDEVRKAWAKVDRLYKYIIGKQ